MCFIIYIDIQIQRYIVVYIYYIYTYYICMNIYDKLGNFKRENNKREVPFIC